MTRNRFQHDNMRFSLFPFLDVLSGVIGILALAIAAMAVIGLRNSKQIIEHAASENSKSPVYVECREDLLVVHPEKAEVRIEDALSGPNAWQAALDRIRNSPTLYLVLLIRPDGYSTFYEAIHQARQWQIDIGYDAVAAIGEIEIRQITSSKDAS